MFENLYSKFRRITSNESYFPEIDGIRFLAICLVILFHTHGYFTGKTLIEFKDNSTAYAWLNVVLLNGDKGVPLFFVLSGFILCLPFAKQYLANGKKIELKKYYLRRVTRLEPPYFIAMLFLFLAMLLMKVNNLQQLVPSLLASLIYSHGFIFHRSPLITVVAWSLEIEIQFYILAPLLFKLLKLNVLPRRILLILGTIGFIICQHYYKPPFENLFTNIQYFLMGILIADFYVCDYASRLFKQKWVAIVAIVLLMSILYLPIKTTIDKTTVYNETQFYAILIFPFVIGLFYYIILKNEILKKIFSYKFIPVIGGMCYSIYLLHYSIISFFGRFTIGLKVTNYYLPNLIFQTIILSIPVLLISGVFYFYIERPFMSKKWTEKLMGKKKIK